MAFTQETGSGVLGANAYGTIAGYVAYWADRGVTIADSDAVKQSLLIKASRYIDTRWGSRFKGLRKYAALRSRSVFTLTDQPSDGETITVGSVTYTFRTTPTLGSEAEIGATALLTLANMAAVMNSETNADLVGTMFTDGDTAALTVFTANDGVATTEAVSNGSFDAVASAGSSNKRQPMEFPRTNLRDRDGNLVIGIPDKLVWATYEYAYRASSAALAPDPTVDETGLQLTKDRSKVGPLESEKEFMEGSAVRITKPYPTADRMLEEYVTGGMGVIRA